MTETTTGATVSPRQDTFAFASELPCAVLTKWHAKHNLKSGELLANLLRASIRRDHVALIAVGYPWIDDLDSFIRASLTRYPRAVLRSEDLARRFLESLSREDGIIPPTRTLVLHALPQLIQKHFGMSRRNDLKIVNGSARGWVGLTFTDGVVAPTRPPSPPSSLGTPSDTPSVR